MKLTLSFDNGPDPVITSRVLDVLASHRLRAFFFVLGKHLTEANGRALVERMHAEGHFVGNHSFSHAVPLGDDSRPDAEELEIGAAQALLSALVPREAPSFRPFGGGGVLGPHLFRQRTIDYLCRHDYSCMLWNSIPRDWEDPQGWPEVALADLSARRHTLIVLHDIEGACLERLDDFLREVQARGHELVTEIPAECVPIRAGKIVGDLSRLVRPSERVVSGGNA